MLRSIMGARVLAAVAVAALTVSFAAAQERGEHITGSITSVDGRNLVVKSDDGRDIRIRVIPSTEVYFQDSGDRKLFPNPGIDDLRAGLGVNFNYNDGTPSRIVVHFVPAGFVRPTEPGTGGGGTTEWKARIQSVDRMGRELTADVQGRSRRFEVADRRETQGLRAGDMVTIWVEERSSGPVITRIESADLVGTIRRMDTRGRSVTIDTDGREETYDVDNTRLFDTVRVGDRVRYVVEDVRGRRVVTSMTRRGAPRN
jgi:hypothetical protein